MSDIVILLLLLSAAIPIALLFVLATRKSYEPLNVYHETCLVPPEPVALLAPLQLMPPEEPENAP